MKKVIFDCDTGTDDAVALMLLVLSKKFEVLGITCVWGNQGVDVTTDNTLRVLDFMDSDIPVYKGCDEPFNKQLQEKRFSFLKQGPIFYTDEKNVVHHLHPEKLWIPDSKHKTEEKHAVDFMVEACRQASEKITIICVGPTTNLAKAIEQDPSIVEHIEKVVFMGGSYNMGNVTKYAEANFFNDADALKVILDSQVPCAMATLNATHACGLRTKEDGDILLNAHNKYTTFAAEILRWRADVEYHLGWKDGIIEPVHDPLAVAYLLDPSIITKRQIHQVDVQTALNPKTGSLIVDEGVGNPNVELMLDANREAYLNLWLDILK